MGKHKEKVVPVATKYAPKTSVKYFCYGGLAECDRFHKCGDCPVADGLLKIDGYRSMDRSKPGYRTEQIDTRNRGLYDLNGNLLETMSEGKITREPDQREIQQKEARESKQKVRRRNLGCILPGFTIPTGAALVLTTSGTPEVQAAHVIIGGGLVAVGLISRYIS